MKAEDIIDILKFFIGTIIVVAGWLVAHFLTNRRDRNSKRREISLVHLISSYRILADEVAHREDIDNRKLELVIADIQLFGSNEQIQLAKNLANDASQKRHFELDPLINSLRDSLRKELELSAVQGNIKWLRFSGDTKAMPTGNVNRV